MGAHKLRESNPFFIAFALQSIEIVMHPETGQSLVSLRFLGHAESTIETFPE
jgi:hypothetical protein